MPKGPVVTWRKSGACAAALAAAALGLACGCTRTENHGETARLGGSDPAALRKLALEEPLNADVRADAARRPTDADSGVFDLRLKRTEIAAGAPLEGALSAPCPPEELRLLWIDGAQRIMDEIAIAPRTAGSRVDGAEPIAFQINVPHGSIGQLHRLVLVRFASAEAAQHPGAPVSVVAQSRFIVHARQDWNDYAVIVRGGENLSAGAWRGLHRLGITAGGCESDGGPAGSLHEGLPFCADVFNAERNPLRPGAAGDALFKEYKAARDPEVLRRGPGLFDANALAQGLDQVEAAVAGQHSFHPFIWSLGDGLGLSAADGPHDPDQSPATLDVFQGWLQQRYRTLSALNQEWGANFADWSAVKPAPTDATLAALAPGARGGPVALVPEPETPPQTGRENAAAWSDFITFNAFAFARVLREYKAELLDRATPGGFVVHAGAFGVQEPTPFNGWDPVEIGRVFDWAEEHDAPCNRELLRSFAPSMRWMTRAGGHASADLYTLWDRWLRGDSGCVVDAQMLADGAANPDKASGDWPGAQALSADFLALTGGMTHLRLISRHVRDPIAIYYSPASMQVNWLLDCAAAGADWLDRTAAYEHRHHSGLLALQAWSLLLDDLGYSPSYVNPQQLLSGALTQAHTRVLILPRIVALSDAEALALRNFAASGGIVVADGACGTFDGSGKRRGALLRDPYPLGALDADFGIARKDLRVNSANGQFLADARESRVLLRDAISEHPSGPSSPELRLIEPGIVTYGAWSNAASSAGAPALLSKTAGLGRFMYLNLVVDDYAELRERGDGGAFGFLGVPAEDYAKRFGAPAGGEALRLVVGDILADFCPPAAIRAWNDDSTPVRGLRRVRYIYGKDHNIYGLLPLGRMDPDAPGSVAGQSLTKPTAVWVGDGSKASWYDVRQGKYLGTGSAVKVLLEPERATVLAALPYRVERMTLKLRRINTRGNFTCGAVLSAVGAEPGEHLFHVELTNPDGERLPAYAQTVPAAGGRCELQIVLGLNEPAGAYHIAVRDVETGVVGTGELIKEFTEYADVPLFFSPQRRGDAEKKPGL